MAADMVARKGKMATIRNRNGKLYLDYRVGAKRVQRSTGLIDSVENRKTLEKEVIPRLMAKIKLGDLRKPDAKKFTYYYQKFIEIKQNDKSFNGRHYIYKKVDAAFGKNDVDRITRLMVKEYLSSLSIKDSTKKDYLHCIKGVLDIALDDDVLDKNVAAGITFKRTAKVPINPFTTKEIELLLKHSTGMLRSYLGIALLTGMRSGEILGLMRNDILDDRITIKRSISKGNITSPKTIGSIRDVPMFSGVKEFIDERLLNADGLYLFEYNGKFIRDISYFKRRWKKLIEDTGIEYRKIYNTRHTFITAMLNSEKFKIMEIAQIVGHASPQMIMTNYAGFLKDAHLKIDTNISLFGDSLVTVEKSGKLEKVINA